MTRKPNPIKPTPPTIPQQRRALKQADQVAADKEVMTMRAKQVTPRDLALRRWAHVVED